ncbi:MAG TPA: hypothetical protein VFQ61_25060, partial [Polyangiaceae bacterium]|nr:hypothetical protein [Polyangiaceae bacterium]
TTVYAKEAVGGDGPHKDVMAFRVETRKGDNGNDKTESWQLPLAENPQRVVRYRELAYSPSTGMPENEDYWDPYKIHIDGSPDKISKGQWPEEYTEFKKPTGGAVSSGGRIDLWKVINADESVNVNGKTFEHSIHFMKTGNSDPDSVKEYWYVRGIGKVREAGSSQTEELISYTVGGKKGP